MERQHEMQNQSHSVSAAIVSLAGAAAGAAFWGPVGWSHSARAAPRQVADLQAISLHDGVNATPRLTPDGRGGIIVRAEHSASPIADGDSVDYMVLAPRRVGSSHWVAVDAQTVPSLISDAPFGGELLVAVPHTGEDWKRGVSFAHGKVDGTPAMLMIVAERDMRLAANAYTPVPAEVSVFRLVEDPAFGDLHFIRIASRRTVRCYVDVRLAVHDVEGLPLPAGYQGPKQSEVCGASGE